MTTLYERGGFSLTSLDPGRTPKSVEAAAAERLPEVKRFFSEESTGLATLEVFPGLLLSRYPPGTPGRHKVTAFRGPASLLYGPKTHSFDDARDAVDDATAAIMYYPGHMRALISGLMADGVDVQDLVNGATAESVMKE